MWNQKLIPIDTYAKNLNLDNYVPKNLKNEFIKSVVVNSTASILPEESGSSTEIALLKFMHRAGINL